MNEIRRRFLLLEWVLVVALIGQAAHSQERQAPRGAALPANAVARIGESKAANVPEPSSLRGVALSADGKILATYGEPANPQAGRPIHVWDARNGQPLRTLEGHEWPIRAMAISPDGQTLVSSSFDVSEGTGITRVWDLATGQSRHVIAGGGNCLRFAPDGATFTLVVRDKLHVHQTATGQEVRRFLGPTLTLDISPDARRLLAMSHTRDTTLRLVDVNNNRELFKLEGTDGPPKSAVFSPDGRTIAATDLSANVLVWETATGRLVHQLAGHEGRVFALAFSPDGRFLATGGLDQTIRLWELATGNEVHQHAGHQDIITVLAFAEGAARLVSGSTDRTALVWDTTRSLTSQLEPPTFNDDVLKNLWSDLSAATPSRAYLAMGLFAAADEKGLLFLKEQVEGLLIPTKNNRLDQLLRDLNHQSSVVRQRATKELRKLRKIALPLLTKVLEQTESPEVRLRLRYVLSGTENAARFTPSDVRRIQRLIQLAEQVNTPPARAMLELIIAEFPVEHVVKDARETLLRISQAPSGARGRRPGVRNN